MKDFKGKNAYVIGGSSGIGLATAKQLSARGANVMIFARNIDLLEEALEEISARRQSDDQRFEARQLDVSIRSEVQMVLTGAVEDFGPPDLLVNSAGRARPHRFEDVTPDMFEATMRVNLFGPRESIFVLLPYMASGAHIVNVSSVAGFLGVFGYTDYCASKFGLLGFSEALRMELRPKGISVSVLCPPDTDTPGSGRGGQDQARRNQGPISRRKTAAAGRGGRFPYGRTGQGKIPHHPRGRQPPDSPGLPPPAGPGPLDHGPGRPQGSRAKLTNPPALSS